MASKQHFFVVVSFCFKLHVTVIIMFGVKKKKSLALNKMDLMTALLHCNAIAMTRGALG